MRTVPLFFQLCFPLQKAVSLDASVFRQDRSDCHVAYAFLCTCLSSAFAVKDATISVSGKIHYTAYGSEQSAW